MSSTIQSNTTMQPTVQGSKSKYMGDDEDESYVYGTRIEVVNADAFEQAIALMEGLGTNDPYVAVLNLGNPRQPGGGWLGGSQAQEEFLCFRSSLSTALKTTYYPIATTTKSFPYSQSRQRTTPKFVESLILQAICISPRETTMRILHRRSFSAKRSELY